MADVFGTKDLGVKDTSALKTGDTRRSYDMKVDSCVQKLIKEGKSKSEAVAMCKASNKK